ncbi:MAG: hypothetical protein NTZ29_17630 [Verrucomicrobia bacterium]|jgi:hypothetical protein|nr:hypothetical protein [Verrucomicrobiota bacterium]
MKPFLFGKKTLDAEPLRLPPSMQPAVGLAYSQTLRPPSEKHGHDPVVETIKEGDKVVRLVITCGCGERIEVECLYPAGN